jgi:transposase InsO family protein
MAYDLELAGLYPLVNELAADGMPVAVTCRVLKIARQPSYRWLARPVTGAEVTEAYRANALMDAHRDDPEFGYRFLADEARATGESMADRTAWKICAGNGRWSAFDKRKRRGKGRKVGPPAHDDLVKRDFTADGPNRLWLADVTEHRTGEGKLYLCAIKDVWSNRIVGCSIDSRMKSRLAVAALHNAAARRRDVAGCVLHTDRGSRGGFNWSSQRLVIAEVFDGTTSAVGGSGVAAGDAFARQDDAGTACGTRVLAADRAG